MKFRILGVMIVLLSVIAVVSLRESPRITAAPSGRFEIVLGIPLEPARMTATGAVDVLKSGAPRSLFTYAQSVSTQFGSWHSGLQYQGRELPTADYWTVTLTGLENDSQGNPLLPRPSSAQKAIPPAHNIEFVIDDATGQILMSTEW